MSDRLDDRLPLQERIIEIKKILTLTPRDSVHSAALLVQLGKNMLSETELAMLPAAERLELYNGLEAGIAQLKESLDLSKEEELEDNDELLEAMKSL